MKTHFALAGLLAVAMAGPAAEMQKIAVPIADGPCEPDWKSLGGHFKDRRAGLGACGEGHGDRRVSRVVIGRCQSQRRGIRECHPADRHRGKHSRQGCSAIY